LAIAAFLVGIAWGFRGPALTGIAQGLVVETHHERGTAVAVLDDGDRRFDVAERLYREGATKILLYRRQSDRLERAGIKPRTDELARREMEKRRVPHGDVESLPEVPPGKSKFVTVLAEWLEQHPEQSVDLLCERFSSRTWKLLCDRTADAGVVERIHFVPLSHRRFDETNWWRSKEGTVALVNAYFILGYHFLRSGDEPDWVERTDSELRQRAGAKVACE
jgi:hypothetical protein